jgi:hypothetical protein
MDPTKRCPRCNGLIDMSVVRHEKGGTSAVGKCRDCGTEYTEAELLRIPGPGPVGG